MILMVAVVWIASEIAASVHHEILHDAFFMRPCSIWSRMHLDPIVVTVAVAASIAVFVLMLLAVPIVLVRLPVDYFTREPTLPVQRNMALVIGKNVLGAMLVVLGLAMLVLPGQGVLTVIVGLSLIDVPGRRRLLWRLLRQTQVKRATDAIRHRAGKPPLELEPPT